MADEAARREFTARAPELRAALVAELAAVLDRAAGFSADELAVLRHLLDHAGFALSGHLFLPVLAALWGEEVTYVPPVPLPAERARKAVALLRRRGVLEAAAGGGIILVPAALKAAASGPAERKVVVYIAASVDGYIATPDGGLDWLKAVEAPPEDYGYSEFVAGVDTVIMGRKTYDKVLAFPEFPHAGRRVIVLSRKRKGKDARVEFRSGDLAKLVARLKEEPGKTIFVDGGAQAVHALLKKGLVDELVLSTVPVLLGDGVPLFKRGRPEERLRLVASRAYPTGLVQSRYARG